MADKLAFSISVSSGTGEWLNAFAARMGTTRNSAINFILRMGIDAYEEATSRINSATREEDQEKWIEPLDDVPVVRCRYCIYAPRNLGEDCAQSAIQWPNGLSFDDSDSECCPYSCGVPWYSIMPQPDWFCWKGKRKEEQENV